MKRIFLKLPEYYLIVLTILAGYSPPFSFNPIFLVLVFILLFQVVIKNRIVGLIFGSLFLLGNLYFIGALMSELYEFTEFNSSAAQLLFGGLSLWVLNIAASITMIYKYSKAGRKSEHQPAYSRK